MRSRTLLALPLVLALSLLAAVPSFAQGQVPGEELCDSAFQDCRQLLWSRIDAENVEINVAFWFMFDSSLSTKLIEAKNRGVKVRVLVDNDASNQYPQNQIILDQLAAGGIQMRDYIGDGIQHWKMMLFAGQGMVEFSAANYGGNDFVPTDPYRNYIAEAIFFCKTPSVVDSFKTRFDDLWTSDALYRDYANIVRPLARSYTPTALDPEMNFVPLQNYQNRLIPLIDAEQQKIDAIMYRFTVRPIADALIRAHEQRGVPVRLITEQDQYRNATFRWDAFNIDRIHKAGIPVRTRKHHGLMHQKSIILYGQNQVAFGSTNWDEGAVQMHQEHNYFTARAWIKQWFIDQFNRRWNSVNPVGAIEYEDFVPLPPDAPVNQAPANGATGQPTSVTLTWEGGLWAHKYDIYLGTNPNSLPLFAADVMTGSIDGGINETRTVSLAAGTTYHWRIVGKTMADRTANGPTWSFTTSGSSGAPSPTVTSVAPNSGSSNGGTSVTISGTNFQAGATVTFGSSTATNVSVAGSTSITATTPAHTAGTVDVTVRNPDNLSGTRFGGFTYTGTPSGASEIVLYAAEAQVRVGNWSVVPDATAAGGSRIFNSDAGAGKIVTPSANPANYFEITFTANAGTAYHLWMRGRAQNDSPFNDSVHMQFSDSVDGGGVAHWRIGTNEGQEYNLEDCLSCGIQGWGWQDNAWSTASPALIRFQNSGTHTMRVQVREDGLSLDQIVLSPVTYLNASPGTLKNDTTILPKSGGPAPAPTVSSISPSSGSTAGGTAVTITGTNFVSGATVTFDGTSATNVNVVSSTSITATTPAHTAGAVNVVVRNPDNQDVTLTGGFTYTSSGSGLPAPWTNADIGGPAPAGSASFSAGAFTLNGGGADIYGTSDTFHFVYRPMTGDGEIIARVDSMANTNDEFAVAGVMIRSSLAADAPHVSMVVTPSFSGRAKFRYRLTSGGITDSSGPGAGSITLPQWVRLVRTGNHIEGFRSNDGITWFPVGDGSIDVDLGPNAVVGLVVNSHNTSTLCTTTITNVSP